MKICYLIVFGYLIAGITAQSSSESSIASPASSILSSTITKTTPNVTIPDNSTTTSSEKTSVSSSSSEKTSSSSTVATTTAVPEPPNPGSPSTGHWVVNTTEELCVKFEAAIQFQIPFETPSKNETAKLNVPDNATVNNDKSKCGETIDVLYLDFDKNSLGLYFANHSNQISLKKITFTYFVDGETFPGAVDLNTHITVNADNVSRFEVPSGKSYLCKSETKISLENVTMQLQQVQVEAFKHDHKNTFSTAEECKGDETISDIVPIAVGCALAGLVVIVLIAYLVGRRRSRQQGYQSV